jgi:hypothetical protein
MLRRTVGLCLLCLLAIPSYAGQKPPSNAELKARETAQRGRIGYLLAAHLPLLMNDPVRIASCRIHRKISPPSRGAFPYFDTSCSVVGVDGAPPEKVEFELGETVDAPDIDAWLSTLLSADPLETRHGWPADVQQAIRARVLDLGMEKEMVDLVLGGLPKTVDLEKLDDGRVRETWKIVISGDTRAAFTAHATWSVKPTNPASSPASVQDGASASSVSNGLEVFTGLPPQFLNVEFTNGKVTARKTEFAK